MRYFPSMHALAMRQNPGKERATYSDSCLTRAWTAVHAASIGVAARYRQLEALTAITHEVLGSRGIAVWRAAASTYLSLKSRSKVAQRNDGQRLELISHGIHAGRRPDEPLAFSWALVKVVLIVSRICAC